MMTASLTFNRRAFLVLGAAAALPRPAFAAPGKQIAALFAGKVDDGGFMQAGYDGLKLAEARLGATIAFTQGIAPKPEDLTEALRALAKAKPDLVIAHGGQNNAAAKAVAAEFPDIRFAVTQGNVTGPNLASYEVLQEQSAFLAGMLAALTTKTGVVGHMSGIRVTPGLKGRAAYVHGVMHANPTVKVLTNFSGNQDDNPLSKKVAAAMIAEKADIIFTMLNAGRTGAVEACREGGAKQIGNVRDWTIVAPEIFVASAFADSGQALFNAAQDFVEERFAVGQVRQIGLETPEAVRLTMAGTVPANVKGRIETMAAEIAAGSFKVPAEWEGVEFANPA
ncbi:BMP family ABC transporter substrate-binding protein [Bosea caraganae]|uniref:BMP family ABC transporter substrate-binding protein n=1 Tax=Bosea caraganae TaxID=2763117 RepID=A0A370L4V1_9HYPH|nr:BMP family protein [Bosea caraganae]RDJ22331.1 BMP family ABC transporter substrate-binding protein [Bosea caraganae]RDJ23735.1 BMP family ABC transporter substrate-binding protein [Bosea caraganae]